MQPTIYEAHEKASHRIEVQYPTAHSVISPQMSSCRVLQSTPTLLCQLEKNQRLVVSDSTGDS